LIIGLAEHSCDQVTDGILPLVRKKNSKQVKLEKYEDNQDHQNERLSPMSNGRVRGHG